MRLRFLLDWRAGACLWAADDEARARFGYAVTPEALPLDAPLRAALHALMARYDAAFDPDDPAAGPRPPAVACLDAEASRVIARLRLALPGVAIEVP